MICFSSRSDYSHDLSYLSQITQVGHDIFYIKVKLLTFCVMFSLIGLYQRTFFQTGHDLMYTSKITCMFYGNI